MTHRYMRAMLRSATATKLLNGWNGPDVQGSYTVNPVSGPAERWSGDRVLLFVAALEDACVEPLYRESEPVDAYDRAQEANA